MNTIIRTTDSENVNMEVVNEAGAVIKRGGLVAFPTETVYGLGANGMDEQAAAKIYAAKGRPSDNPLIVHVADPSDAEAFAVTNDTYYKLAEHFMPGPLTVILEKKDNILLLSGGKIHDANEGCACPINGIVSQFVSHLKLGKDDIVLLDMEAGVEHFGRGTDNTTDAVLMVIDPSYESLKLSSKISEICDQIHRPIYYVLNKVSGKSEDAMKEKIDRKDHIVGVFPAKDDVQTKGLMGEELTGEYEEISRLIDKLFS